MNNCSSLNITANSNCNRFGHVSCTVSGYILIIDVWKKQYEKSEEKSLLNSFILLIVFSLFFSIWVWKHLQHSLNPSINHHWLSSVSVSNPMVDCIGIRVGHCPSCIATRRRNRRWGSTGGPITGHHEKRRGEPKKNGEMDWVKLPSVTPLPEQPAQCHTLNGY